MTHQLSLKHGRIELVCGNIVQQDTEAIVNAANTQLAGGGGVDGAIHRAAGPTILDQCLQLPADDRGRRCPTGEVRTTHAGNLAAQYIVHAVGPFYRADKDAKSCLLLRQVHLRALEAAAALGCKSIAFPAISTGAYRFPVRQAAGIAIATTREVLETKEGVELVRFVLFSDAQFDVFAETLGTA